MNKGLVFLLALCILALVRTIEAQNETIRMLAGTIQSMAVEANAFAYLSAGDWLAALVAFMIMLPVVVYAMARIKLPAVDQTEIDQPIVWRVIGQPVEDEFRSEMKEVNQWKPKSGSP